ncbi:hypothetical protein F5888DRAFT_1806379 [Russula emetica]|nr:hypothetical protein F5888DRAFT_1806379 [Russula emetica]
MSPASQFMKTTENLSFSCAKFLFSSNEQVVAEVNPREMTKNPSCMLLLFVSTIAGTLTSSYLPWLKISMSSEESLQWSMSLSNTRSPSNVKTLHIDPELVDELARSLRPDDGELSLELLPEMHERAHNFRGP